MNDNCPLQLQIPGLFHLVYKCKLGYLVSREQTSLLHLVSVIEIVRESSTPLTVMAPALYDISKIHLKNTECICYSLYRQDHEQTLEPFPIFLSFRKPKFIPYFIRRPGNLTSYILKPTRLCECRNNLLRQATRATRYGANFCWSQIKSLWMILAEPVLCI